MNAAPAKDFLSKVRHALRLDELSPGVRKLIVGIVGGLVLLAGLALIFLPGPAFVVIPLGLAILASEFAWAKYYLEKARDWYQRTRARQSAKRKRRRSSPH
ncbi:MAG: PGPGW domain-containing protein [Akkermansiaceae bacterium]|nr:PGPGW domain-containing protein [Verrucomicrobiales bacterium]